MTRPYHWKSDETRNARVARAKAMHSDPEFRARLHTAASGAMKARHSDAEFRAACVARLEVTWDSIELRKRSSDRMRALRSDPDFCLKRAAAIAANTGRPGHKYVEFTAPYTALFTQLKKKVGANPARRMVYNQIRKDSRV